MFLQALYGCKVNILEAVLMTGGKPYQSKLIPYVNEIVAMRRERPPIPYSRIAAILDAKYQIEISADGVFKFFKRRVMKQPRQYKYDAWDIKLPDDNNKQTTKISPAQKGKLSMSPVSDKPKQTTKLEVFEMEHSETYNLHRLSPEEAAALRKQLEEEEKKK